VQRRFPNKKKRTCYNCGSTEHFIANCPYEKKSNNYKKDNHESKHEHKQEYKRKKKPMGEAHIGHEWDSSKESSEEDVKIATVAIQKTSSTPRLFNNMSDDDDYHSSHICLMAKGEKAYSSGGSSWVLDSGCTNHMTGERSMFSSYSPTTDSSENIIFGDNSKGDVIGLGKVAITLEHSISDVLHVDSLSYNLLSVSQLCEKGFNCLFTDKGVEVFSREDSSIVFTGRLKNKLYLVDFNKSEPTLETCLVAKSSMGWLWHRRLAHVGMRNLAKLQKDNHILGLTNIDFDKDRICSACQAGKQVGVPHPPKSIMTTTQPLELIHMDLFGPVAYLSIGGNKYGLVIVDDYSRFTWVFFVFDK
jgi:hypothetical protein